MRALAEKHPIIGDVRGIGAFWSLDLVHDRATKRPVAPASGPAPIIGELVAECRKNGLMPFVAANRIHICPPLNITDEQIAEALTKLEAVFSVMDKHYEG